MIKTIRNNAYQKIGGMLESCASIRCHRYDDMCGSSIHSISAESALQQLKENRCLSPKVSAEYGQESTWQRLHISFHPGYFLTAYRTRDIAKRLLTDRGFADAFPGDAEAQQLKQQEQRRLHAIIRNQAVGGETLWDAKIVAGMEFSYGDAANPRKVWKVERVFKREDSRYPKVLMIDDDGAPKIELLHSLCAGIRGPGGWRLHAKGRARYDITTGRWLGPGLPDASAPKADEATAPSAVVVDLAARIATRREQLEN